MVIGFAASVITDYTGLTDMIGGAAVLLFAAVLGLTVRYRYAACEQLIERAKLTERELLARKLHDTVAHHVSAIAIPGTSKSAGWNADRRPDARSMSMCMERSRQAPEGFFSREPRLSS